MPNVPAGRYRIAARSIGPIGAIWTALAEVTIDADDVENLVLTLQPALRITGLVVFRGDRSPPVVGTSMTSVPLSVPLSVLLGADPPVIPMQFDGVRFSIEGLAPGPFRMRGNIPGLQKPLDGLWLQSVVANGVELLDAPLDISRNVTDAVAAFADRASEVSGRVTGDESAPLSGVTVVAFSTDRSRWFAGSRRVTSVTSDRDGRYVIRNLPPGEYRLAASSGFEPLEWFDAVRLEELLPAATPLTLAGTEKKAVDLRAR